MLARYRCATPRSFITIKKTEAVGFEPTGAMNSDGFQDRCNKPGSATPPRVETARIELATLCTPSIRATAALRLDTNARAGDRTRTVSRRILSPLCLPVPPLALTNKVGEEGFEPSHLTAPDPKSGASTSFAIRPKVYVTGFEPVTPCVQGTCATAALHVDKNE
jgi:hypothetical protein